MLPELGGLLRRPLLTLERVRICKRDGELLGRPPSVLGAQPLSGQTRLPLAQKLMVYTSESALHDGQPIQRAIVRRLRSAGISGATTQRGMWGFHGDHPPHGDRLLQLGRHVPAVTIVIDTPERIADRVRPHRRPHRGARPRHLRDGPGRSPGRRRPRDDGTARLLSNQGVLDNQGVLTSQGVLTRASGGLVDDGLPT